MGLRLLKKLSSRRLGAGKSPKGNQGPSSSLGDEVETLSGSSHRSQICTEKGALVESLSQKGKFDEAIKIVSESSLDDWFPEGESEEGKDSGTDCWPTNTTTPLHLILEHNPPPPEVQSMIKVLRDRFQILIPEEFSDHNGRTPLHIAVTASCTGEVIQLLLEGESQLMPAVLKDSMHRTPLHWACRPVRSQKNRKQTAMAEWHQKEAIRILLREFPEAASLRDVKKKTPLDYARETRLSSRSLMEALQKEHDEYVPKLESMAEDANGYWFPPHVPAGEPGPDCSTVGSHEPLADIELCE